MLQALHRDWTTAVGLVTEDGRSGPLPMIDAMPVMHATTGRRVSLEEDETGTGATSETETETASESANANAIVSSLNVTNETAKSAQPRRHRHQTPSLRNPSSRQLRRLRARKRRR